MHQTHHCSRCEPWYQLQQTWKHGHQIFVSYHDNFFLKSGCVKISLAKRIWMPKPPPHTPERVHGWLRVASSGAHHGFASLTSASPDQLWCAEEASRHIQNSSAMQMLLQWVIIISNQLSNCLSNIQFLPFFSFLLFFFCDRRFWPFFVSSLNSGCLRSFALKQEGA